MSREKSSHIYALSLFEVAKHHSMQAEYASALAQTQTILECNPLLLKALCSPIVEKKDKYIILQSIFSSEVPLQVLNFLMLLCEKSRMDEFFSIVKEFSIIDSDDKNIKEFQITSAFAISEETVNQIKQKLADSTGKSIIITQKIDKEIIGGILIESDNEEFDGTIKTKLKNIADNFIKCH